MDLVEVQEGAAKLLVPAGNRERGPGTRGEGVFFNPAMALSRDVSLAVYRAELPEGARVLDGLAASGARAVRLALAAPALRVAANDWSPDAAELCRRNAESNGAAVEVHRRSLGALLWETTWDAVDVDPFGSPAPFVDAACRALRRRGLLALTATDTTALYGVYPDACERRYQATPMRCEFGHELAVRILAGFAVRQAAKHDLALAPVLAHATDHFYRVYLRGRRGAGRADDALASVGVAWRCVACGARALARAAPDSCSACDGAVQAAGPLWAGPLQDPALAAKARAEADAVPLARGEETRALLDRLVEEADAAPLYWDVHEAAGRAGVDPPPFPRLFEALRAAGFTAARTHMRATAVRTDADVAGLAAALRASAPPRP